jgi:hypothetical protein
VSRVLNNCKTGDILEKEKRPENVNQGIYGRLHIKEEQKIRHPVVTG